MSKSDDKKFNETLQRMLKTPPKPHADKSVDESANKPKKKDGRATGKDERARTKKSPK